jgi:hypothetical protein
MQSLNKNKKVKIRVKKKNLKNYLYFNYRTVVKAIIGGTGLTKEIFKHK